MEKFMKTAINYKIAKILLLLVFCCPFAFTQFSITYMQYKGELQEVITEYVGFVVKKDYFNDELLKKLESPSYSPTYSVVTAREKSGNILLKINDKSEDINVLDHYLKFEKEEFVEVVYPYEPLKLAVVPWWKQFDIKGQVIHNGKPLTNHIVNLFFSIGIDGIDSNAYLCNSITDENGNYIFPKMEESALRNISYTLSFKIGDTKYGGNIFRLDKDKVIDFKDGDIVGNNESEGYSLFLSNYPNPFNPITTIQFSVPKDEFVKLTVYDMTGKVVKELINGYYKVAGTYNVVFNATGLASGVYFYELNTSGKQLTNKMLLMK